MGSQKKGIHRMPFSFGGDGGIRFSAEKPSDGSDSPPDCHSLPSVRILPYIKEKRHPLDTSFLLALAVNFNTSLKAMQSEADYFTVK